MAAVAPRGSAALATAAADNVKKVRRCIFPSPPGQPIPLPVAAFDPPDARPHTAIRETPPRAEIRMRHARGATGKACRPCLTFRHVFAKFELASGGSAHRRNPSNAGWRNALRLLRPTQSVVPPIN